MPLLNTFLVGTDPEFVVLRNGSLTLQRLQAHQYIRPWGYDHSNWVVEAHPKPELSVRALLANLKKSLNDYALVAPEGTWRAGAIIEAPERTVTLGGHIHIDQPRWTEDQMYALDRLTQHLEKLDVVPKEQCNARRRLASLQGNAYGRMSDFRQSGENHFEYRSQPSWLFSQRATKLALVGGKLCAAQPKEAYKALGPHQHASVPKLTEFFEAFKEHDDDAKWIVQGGILRRKINMDPTRDLRKVWAVRPEEETPHWKEEVVKQKQRKVG